MKLYDAIFYRKSIRSYSNTKIKEPLMAEVKDICSDITYLNKSLNIKAHVVDRGHLIHFLMGKECRVKAPHYIVVTSNKGEDYLENIGFAMEKVILQLTSLGLATCWLESNLKREDILEFIELEEIDENDEEISLESIEEPYVVIAFGYPEKSEELFRNLESKLDREKLKDISKKVDKSWNKALEAVRMAPSIKNCQPWFFYNDIAGLHLYERNQKKSLENMSKVSIGIAMSHLDIACSEFGLKISYKKIEAKKRIGKNYFITIKEECM